MDKNKKICISIIIFLVLLILVMLILNYFNIGKQTLEVPLEELSIQNSIDENTIESNTIQTSIAMIDNNTLQENVIVGDTSTNKQEEQITTENKEVQEKKEQTNVKTQTTNVQTKKTDTKVESTKPDSKVETGITNNSSTQQNVSNKEQNTGNPALANTKYTEVNTEVIPEIINILNNEISKDEELKNFGTKAIKGNKADAYANTSGFTYRFVKDINKGKVKGNYAIFEQRVRNVVGAFGKYYVYAEDEYVYDSKGISPHWSQTLVWIYITF